MKGTNEQPDEEVPRERSGSVLDTGTSVPVKFGVCHPPGS